MSLLQVIFGTLSWLPMKSVHWRVPCTNRGCWGAVVTPLHGLCPRDRLGISATTTRWCTLSRRKPIQGGSAAPSLAQRVSLAPPQSLSCIGTARERDGVWTKSRPLAAGMPPSRLQGSIHTESAFVRTPGRHRIASLGQCIFVDGSQGKQVATAPPTPPIGARYARMHIFYRQP